MKKNKKKLILVIILVVLLVATPTYALCKYYHFGDTLKSWFNLSDDELNSYGVSSSVINLTKKFDDASITIEEAVLDEKELFISVSITGKKDAIYLDEAYLSKGKSFDESILNTSILEDGSKYIYLSCDNEDYACGMFGFGLMEEDDLTNSYTLSMTLNGSITKEDVTLRLVSDSGNIYDIPFTLNKNAMKEKEKQYETIVYNENDLVLTIKSIRLTPLHVMVDIEYNKDIYSLTEDELEDVGNKVYNDNNGDDCYVTYKDGTTTTLRLWYSGYDESMLSPYGIHGTKENQVNDIDNIKSITINNITLDV
jgi:hypothetical protein